MANSTSTHEPHDVTRMRRLRAVLPADLYRSLLHEAVEREVSPNQVLILALQRLLKTVGSARAGAPPLNSHAGPEEKVGLRRRARSIGQPKGRG